jgi:hypothetical protein
MLRFAPAALVGALATCMSFACGDKNAPHSPVPLEAGAVTEVGAVSFSTDIMPLLTKSCSCHVTGSTAPSLGNYQNVLSSADISNTAIQSGSMPPAGPLPAKDKDLFQSWIDAGKPNN